MKWFCRGDIDGFFGLALDNLIQILLIVSLCLGVIGMPSGLVFGTILPGVALSLLVGNIFYAKQAINIGRREGRDDVCALPYGINTPTVFIYVFLVMLPVKLAAMSQGISEVDASHLAWQAGLIACIGSGIIELGGSFFARFIRSAAPRAALLSTLSGIALGFISLPFLFRTFDKPIVGFTTLAIIMMIYFGRVRFRFHIPGGLVAVIVGSSLAWMTGLAPATNAPPSELGFFLPQFVGGDLYSAFQAGYLTEFINVVIPMGVFNLIGALQNIESADAAGDSFPIGSSLSVNGVGTVVAGLFGSCFPTTIYIGHPGWKALGARAGYSVLNGLFMTMICLTGTATLIFWAVPIEAGMAIVLWIGLIITAQAFAATPKAHAPAATIGILVGVGAWGSFMAKAGLRVGDTVLGNELVWKEQAGAIMGAFAANDISISGAFALEHGCIFTAMVFSAITVFIIERKFNHAAFWAFAGAGLSLVGFTHSYTWSFKDAPLALEPAYKWAIAYFVVGLIFISARWITKPVQD